MGASTKSWLDQTKIMSTTYQTAAPYDSDEPDLGRRSNRAITANTRLWQRLLPLVAITTSSAIALLIGFFELRGVRESEYFHHLVSQRRATLQVIVHILSTLLSLLWTFAVCSAFNLFIRASLSRRPISLSRLRLYTAISQARFELNLPLLSFLGCATFCVVTVLPGWLWTGALTPQFAPMSISGAVILPRVGLGAYPFLATDRSRLGNSTAGLLIK